MPSGAWNGIKLVEILDDRPFLAVSNRILEICPDSGKTIWQVETGNTPIYQILKSLDLKLLIVFNGYYGFESREIGSNIAAFNLDGTQRWRAQLPYKDDIFANLPYYEGGVLKSGSWGGYTCSIDQTNGQITNREFTK